MIITFLVEVNLDTLSDLIGQAQDMQQALESSFDVISVKPWSRPTTAPLPNSFSAKQPTTNNNTTT